MPHVLITGAGGQVGRELVDAFAGYDITAADRTDLDITDEASVRSAIRTLRPDVVVNAAAWTDVDGCEADPVRAHLVNAAPLRWLSEACAAQGARLCHISTDYVFDGRSSRPYTESDPPNPVSVYGRSKRAGELELDASATLVRTSWVFGVHGHNIVKTVLGLLGRSEPLRFVDDQVGCPTEAAELARSIRHLIDGGHHGTFHVVNEGAMSWFELARHVAACAGSDIDQILPVATADLVPPRPAPRPANSRLARPAAEATGIPLPGPATDAIARVVSKLVAA